MLVELAAVLNLPLMNLTCAYIHTTIFILMCCNITVLLFCYEDCTCWILKHGCLAAVLFYVSYFPRGANHVPVLRVIAVSADVKLVLLHTEEVGQLPSKLQFSVEIINSLAGSKPLHSCHSTCPQFTHDSA